MKKAVLGLKLNPWHDTGAALVWEYKGQLRVVAISEERLDRKKNSRSFPKLAIEYCLNVAGLNIEELSAVVADFIFKPEIEDYSAAAEETELANKRGFFRLLENAGVPYYFVGHHLCHAAAAFYASGYVSATGVVIDGLGSHYETQSIYQCGPTGLRRVAVSRKPGIGNMYTSVTESIIRFSHLQEGKTMGLAAWGDVIDPEGKYDFSADYYQGIDTPYSRFMQFYPEIMIKRPDDLIARGEGNLADTSPFVGYARDAQSELEKAVLHVMHFARSVLPFSHNLCYSGGVALNIPANRTILDSGLFQDVFIFPAASDAGIPMGAALYGYYQVLQGTLPYKMENAFMGREYGQEEIDAAVAKWDGLNLKGYSMEQVAGILANNYILGWFDGPSEYGPRALGARSLLCSPRHPGMKDYLNAQVKHRESFRPFAPLVTLENQENYFDLPAESPYMLINTKVKPEWRSKIPAVMHVDGTARVQSVSQERQPKLHNLLKAFEKSTGMAVLLNTSFNLAGEPIVETPEDAVTRLAASQIDALVIGDYLLTKRSVEEYLAIDNQRNFG